MIKNPPEYVSHNSGEEDVVNVNVNNDGSEVNGSQGKLDVDTILDGNLNLVRDMQRSDPYCNVMYSLLCGRMCSQEKFDNAKISKRIALFVYEQFFIVSGVLWKHVKMLDNSIEDRVVCPKGMVKDVISFYHDRPLAGHCGSRRTIGRVLEKFWWFGIHDERHQNIYQFL